MPTPYHINFKDLDEDAVVRTILEGTATETGAGFFAALVENLSKALNTQSAWVTEFIEKSRQLRSLAFWADGELMPNFEMDIDGTPCKAVVETARLVHYPDKIIEFFPNSYNIKKFRAASYMGVPLLDSKGTILGNLAGEIQKSLLPHEKPFVQGLDIAGRNDSCDEIGGDYNDILRAMFE